MSGGIDPVRLRERAAALRALVRQIQECPTAGLGWIGDHETWLGPTADRFRTELAAHQQQLQRAMDDLRARARALELQADAASPVRGVF